MSTSEAIRASYLRFYEERGHTVIPRAAIVPREDPTTLFTGSGMQPLIPYLLGASHPAGDRLVDSQTCFRAEDIDEVGDNRHTTFFEMLGNWGLGSYFKAEQLPWVFSFLLDKLALDPGRLYVSVFAGAPSFSIPRDDESAEVWTGLFSSHGLSTDVAELQTSERAAGTGNGGARINFYDESLCWWSRVGSAAGMPPGEPGGPDSEMFYLFPQVEHDEAFGQYCHPHCDCGRYLEIGNSVFMEYRRTDDGFIPLPQRNVDFGGGLERLCMAAADTPDVFRVDLLWPIVTRIESLVKTTYDERREPMRVIADHIRAIVFFALDGLDPSNTAQGYVMRRLARRALRKGLQLVQEADADRLGPLLPALVDPVVECYGAAYPELQAQHDRIVSVLEREEKLFRTTLGKGVREFARVARTSLTGEGVFTLFDTYGFPPELSIEEAREKAIPIEEGWAQRYEQLMGEQRERSRTASQGTFKGGLADQSEATTRLHTATHLLYKALRTVLGDHVIQRGSNITPERLRFDFSHPAKVSPEEQAEIERIVNENIARDWPMGYRELSPEQAFAEGALGAFGDKYGDIVKVYTAGDPDGEWFSKEICGGPHVDNTGVLGPFHIVKEESSSAGVRRIRAVVD
jgi:alanyl-tRNA synthetase